MSAITSEAFSSLFDRISSSPAKRDLAHQGTLRHITPERRLKALQGIREAAVVSLGRVLDTNPGPMNSRPVIHAFFPPESFETPSGDGFAHFGEFLGMRPHGRVLTHVDALCHFHFRGRSYGGQTHQPETGSIMLMEDGIITRGVLLDVPRSQKKQWLEPGETIMTVDLEQATEAQHLEFEPGDALFVSTGRESREGSGAPVSASKQAGLHPDTILWIENSGFSIFGSDGTHEVNPGVVDGVGWPFHILSLVGLGLPLVDNLALDRLARECQARGRWDFTLFLSPLKIHAGTGSPVNPIAIF